MLFSRRKTTRQVHRTPTILHRHARLCVRTTRQVHQQYYIDMLAFVSGQHGTREQTHCIPSRLTIIDKQTIFLLDLTKRTDR